MPREPFFESLNPALSKREAQSLKPLIIENSKPQVSKLIMTPKHWLLSFLVFPLLLSACVQPGSRTGGSNNGASQKLSPVSSEKSADNEQTDQSNNTITKAIEQKNPGRYETVLKDDVECRQGRFQTGSHGGKLTALLVGSDPKTLNPWVADDALSQELCNLLFRGLVDVDHCSGEIIPDMATEISVDPDKMTYTTRLRKGLKWSDGSPINSEDVAFTWNKIIAQGYGNLGLREAAMVDGKMPTCSAVDELTNKFVSAKPYAPFMRVLAAMKIAPRHTLESTMNLRSDFKALWSLDKDTSQIVTSGPFIVASFEPGQKIEFSRASSFYMVDKNGSTLPYLDRVVFLIVPDTGSAVLEFGKKNADIAQFRPRDLSWLSSQALKQNFKLYNLGPSNGSFFLVFNMNQRLDAVSQKPFLDPVKSAWFNDRNFRQAVNHAINRQKMLADFYKGAGSALFRSQPDASPFCNRELKPFSADPKASLELLAKSEFIKKPDGLLYDKNGKAVEFTLSYASKSNLYDFVAHAIAAELKELGMNVKLEALEASQIQEKINAAKPSWDALLYSVTGDPLDPNSSAAVYRTSGSLHLCDLRKPALKAKPVADDARPWEKRIDEIYEQAAVEFNKDKRKELYFEAEKIIYDEAPFIFLLSPNVIIGARNTIKNFQPTALSQASLGLHNIEEIYIELPGAEIGKTKASTKNELAEPQSH